MQLKIVNGTRSDSISLCDSCAHIINIKGSGESKVIKRCSYLGKSLKFNVAECSQYYPKNLPSLRILEDIGWVLSSDKRKIGFNPPIKRKDPGMPMFNPFEIDN